MHSRGTARDGRGEAEKIGPRPQTSNEESPSQVKDTRILYSVLHDVRRF